MCDINILLEDKSFCLFWLTRFHAIGCYFVIFEMRIWSFFTLLQYWNAIELESRLWKQKSWNEVVILHKLTINNSNPNFKWKSCHFSETWFVHSFTQKWQAECMRGRQSKKNNKLSTKVDITISQHSQQQQL